MNLTNLMNFINYSYQPLSAYLFSNLLISNPDIASPKFSDNSANLTGSFKALKLLLDCIIGSCKQER